MATITESSVAMMAMPNEFRSAEVNSESSKTVRKFSQVQSSGKNDGVPVRKVSGLLNASDVIHKRGNRAQARIRRPQTVHQLLVLLPITHPP